MPGSHWDLQRRILLLMIYQSMRRLKIISIDGAINIMMNMCGVTKTITIMSFLTAAATKPLRTTMRTITMTMI